MKIELISWSEFPQFGEPTEFSAVERAKQAARQILEGQTKLKSVTVLVEGRMVSRFTKI